jgi:hypothetical protein
MLLFQIAVVLWAIFLGVLAFAAFTGTVGLFWGVFSWGLSFLRLGAVFCSMRNLWLNCLV